MKGGTFDITLASPAPEDRADLADEIATVCDRYVSWPEPHTGLGGKAAALMSALPVPVATDRSRIGAARVAEALSEKPAVVVVDFPHASVLLPDEPFSAASVIFTHNIEAEIFERHAAVAAWPMRLLWQSQARKMRRFEQSTLRRFDTVIAVSARDARSMEAQYGLSGVATIDTGVDLDFYGFSAPQPAPPGGGTLVFSGAMDSRSNIDGVTWLAEAVWQRIAAARPQAEMLILGRNPPEALVAKVARLGLPFRFSGFVEDMRPHVRSGHVALIPLRVGSGTRIKAFEAMALGRPVVSTALGVEGLDLTPGTHYLAGDSAEAFADAVLACFDDPAGMQAMAQRARAHLEAHFSWGNVARQFEAICLQSMQTTGR